MRIRLAIALAVFGSGAGLARVPTDAATPAEQATVCDGVFDRHVSSRARDLLDGTLQWACGDVPGVAGKDLGIEYCEYRAIAKTKGVVTTLDAVGAAEPVACIFNSVFSDHKSKVKPPTAQKANQDEATGRADSLKRSPDLAGWMIPRAAAMMGVQNNSREAAESLVNNCATLQLPNDDNAKVAALVAKRRGLDAERQADIAGCLAIVTLSSQGDGVPWRNSDVNICSRVFRAAHECGAKFSAIPATLSGFEFTGWTNALPAGCRYGKIDGQPDKHHVICDLSPTDVAEARHSSLYRNDLRMLCHDRFADNLVMRAPLHALVSNAPALTVASPFCKAFAQGIRRSR